MGNIRVLPEYVVNRIAAGEVVERPASVVKELVENSLDAQADRVEVELELGGCRLVKVSDNGVGMTADDLELAWVSHATSKLSDPEELNGIRTLGFRGEALPSIGAIAQAMMTSRARGTVEGGRIAISGGKLGKAGGAGCPEGTVVEVRNLFFNTPVRKKFLRTPKTEEAHSVEAFTRLTIPHTNVTFHLTCDGRESLRLPGPVDLIERIRELFGEGVAGQLVRVSGESALLTVGGYAGHPGLNRSNAQMIYTFLNGRHIRDRLLMRAISESYRALLPAGRLPVVFLLLELDASRVDVNVHPCKTEVRFREPDALYRQVLGALQRAAGNWRAASAPVQESAPPLPAQARREEIKRAITDFLQSRPGPSRPFEQTTPAAPARAAGLAARRFYQFRNSYIVEETADGINIIDQHALHERILYESLARSETRAVQTQRLLVPDVVDLKPRDLQLVLEMRGALAMMGIEVEEFGGNSVAIRSLPPLLQGIAPGRMLVDMLDELRGESDAVTQQESVRRLVACKGAVKAGQPLTQEQIAALLKRRDELDIAPTCPHGRPTTYHLSDHDIARKFMRG